MLWSRLAWGAVRYGLLGAPIEVAKAVDRSFTKPRAAAN